MQKKPLIDGVLVHKNFPKTFLIPTESEKRQLRPRDWVKVQCDKERFWVQIKDIRDGEIRGIVSNDLVFSKEHGIQNGDELYFEDRHVIDFISSP